MVILPAIDLRNGRVVRLKQGDFAQETIYNDDPLGQAGSFAADGASWLHLVDLDGARGGEGQNAGVIRQIKAGTKLRLQLGGGIRSLSQMAQWFEAGIDRLVIGTLALENPAAVREAVQEYGSERIVVSLDTRAGIVATRGWEQASGRNLTEAVLEMLDLGVSRILYTDIARDGMLSGPDFDTLERLNGFHGLRVIASGGVSSLEDIQSLKEKEMDGVIIGEALYRGVLSLPQIFQEIR